MADNPKAKDLITNDDTPILTGTYDSSDSNGFLTVTVDGTTYTLGTDAELTTSNNTWTLDLSAAAPLAEGSYTVDVAAQDALGNPLSTGFNSELTVDTTVIAPPSLEVFGDGHGTEGDAFIAIPDLLTAGIRGNVEPFSTVEAYLSILGTPYGADPFATIYADENGDFEFKISQLLATLPTIDPGISLAATMAFGVIDSAGNSSIVKDGSGIPTGEGLNPVQAFFDTAAHSLMLSLTEAIVLPPTVDTQNTSSTSPVITGTYGFDGSPLGANSLSVTVGGSTYTLGADAALTTDGAENWSLDLSVAGQTLDAGIYNVIATHGDIAGNFDKDETTSELKINYDATGAITTPTVNHLETSNFKPYITGLFDPAATSLNVSINGSTYSLTDPELSNNGKLWILDLSGASALPEGVLNVVATQDVGGSITSSTSSNQIVIDRAEFNPIVRPNTTADGDTLINGWFHASQADTFTVSVNGSTYTLGVDPELTNAGNNWTLDLASTLAPGKYNVVATSTDALGNISTDATNTDIHILEAAGVNEAITPNFKPTITGQFDHVTTDELTVEIAGTTYTLGTDTELSSLGGGQWALDLGGVALDKGFHDVVVTATDNDTATVTTDNTVDEIGIFNVIGTAGSETLTGNLGATNGIISNGGYDTIIGGNLDDVIAVTDNNFLSIDGGKGLDTLILAGDNMNLSSVDFTKLFSIEAMDLSGGNGSNNTVSLSTQDVLDMSSTDSLILMGDSTDTVHLGDWSLSTGSQVIDSVTYDSYSDNGASLLIEQGIQVFVV